MATSNLYLYLARRDKVGIRILAKFQGRNQLAVRLEDISGLQLPDNWQAKLTQIIYDARMMWEPWIESAEDFDELRQKFKIRGYSQIPVTGQPEFTISSIQTPTINVSNLPKKTTMIRKN